MKPSVLGAVAIAPSLSAGAQTHRSAGINIVAIHQHMTHERPRYLFLHYWGKGKAADLASAVQSAIVAQKAAR